MGVFTITYKNYPVHLEVEPDFPKCTCGETFKVQDCYNKKKVFQLTAANCSNCGENFCGESYKDLKNTIPKAQIKRDEYSRI